MALRGFSQFAKRAANPRDMRPTTLSYIRRELDKARKLYPGSARNNEILLHAVARLQVELAEYDLGKIAMSTVYSTALEIAVLSIRVAEDGAGGDIRDYGSQPKFKLEAE